MKEYLQLLAQRESHVVLGKKWVNMWLLVVVLIATFISIAFSNGSMAYLKEKMSDPFTNWVNIQNAHGSGKFSELHAALQREDVRLHYGYKDIQSDHYFPVTLLGSEDETGHRPDRYLECRFFEQLNSDLMRAILSENNVVGNSAISVDELDNSSLGFIITIDNLRKLGYDEECIPAYIDYLANSDKADTLGFKLYYDRFVAAPMPILAVVRRLPQNMDLIASGYWLCQYNNDNTHPFDFNNESYQRSLFYFVNNEISDFEEKVMSFVPDSLSNAVVLPTEQIKHMNSWSNGCFLQVFPDERKNIEDLSVYVDIAKKISSEYDENSVKRVFAYDCSDYSNTESAYLSVNFEKLDSIRSFEAYVKENFNIQIEMSQVNSKENFSAVSFLASILSWAMIVFSIVCIILFIVNMLQSYFQKVKRNMGTFKAFGISTFELIETYVIILSTVIIVSIGIALLVTSIVQYGLHYAGIMKEGQFDYLSLWSETTIWIAIIIIFIATIATVYFVMNRLLKQTPGDLIYDR